MSKFHAQTWFVTGASGLVGSTVIKHLRDNDLSVIGLVRNNSPESVVNFLLDLDVKLVYGDLLHPESYTDYLPTCDVVVHTAAAVQVNDKQINWNVNVKGTEYLCQKMTEVGVTRLIHISTAGIYGKPQTKPVTEDIKPKPRGAYVESKFAAEQIIRKFKGISSTIIRPPLIYGDPTRDRHIYRTLIEKLPHKILPRIWRYNPKIGFVHADDIARLVLQTGSLEQTPSDVYNIQSFDIPLNRLLDIVNDARHTQPIALRIPYAFFYIAALIGELWYKLKKRPYVIRERLKIVKKNWTFSASRVRNELGFEPSHVDHNQLEMLFSEYDQISNGTDDEINIRQLVESEFLES